MAIGHVVVSKYANYLFCFGYSELNSLFNILLIDANQFIYAIIMADDGVVAQIKYLHF